MRTDSTAVGTSEWLGQSGQSWAEHWRRTDRGFSVLTERLLQGTRAFDFGAVLDIGCGAGELSLAIARGRPHCRVIGVDIAPPLIAAARERGAHHPDVVFELADAATWRPAAPFAPDLLVSRHGVMFFDDPVAAFANLRELAAPGAALMFSCFRERELNPALTDAALLLPEPPPPPADPRAPGPFAFAEREYAESILARAGWAEIAFEVYDFAMIIGAGADPIEDSLAYLTTIGPAARAARALNEAEREAFYGRLRDLARRNLREGIVSLRAAAWIVTARKA